jgi:hypothetical protein
MSHSNGRIQTFGEFYWYYLSEHRHPISRTLHFIGTFGVIMLALITPFLGKWWMFGLIPLMGYGFAWVGHFFFEKNKPATFKYPLWSLGSDFVMFFHIITGQIRHKLAIADQKYPIISGS